MMQDCLNIFRQQYEQKGLSFVLNNYRLSPGYYYVYTNGNWECVKIPKKTETLSEALKTSELYQKLVMWDYCSKVLEINKTYSNKKNVLSYNCYAFFVKLKKLVTGEITDVVVSDYFEHLRHVEKKYSKKVLKAYESFVEEHGAVNQQICTDMEELVIDKLNHLDEIHQDEAWDVKDELSYVKFFLDAPVESYVIEMYRYWCVNLFASRDTMFEKDGVWYGVPSQGLSLDTQRQKYVRHITRDVDGKTLADGYPCLSSFEDMCLRKFFFTWLESCYNSGNRQVMVCTTLDGDDAVLGDMDKLSDLSLGDAGYVFQLTKDQKKGLYISEIYPFSYVSDIDLFEYEDFIEGHELPKKAKDNVQEMYHLWQKQYRGYEKVDEIFQLLRSVLFWNVSLTQLYSDANDVSVSTDGGFRPLFLQYRDVLIDFQRNGDIANLYLISDTVLDRLIRYQLESNNRQQVFRLLNLKWSLQKYLNGGCETMGDCLVELRESLFEKICSENPVGLSDDREYYFAMGQLVSYLNSLDESATRNQSRINTILFGSDDKVMKAKIQRMYQKYNYKIGAGDKRFNALMSMVMSYTPVDKSDMDALVIGFTTKNVIFTKKENDGNE